MRKFLMPRAWVLQDWATNAGQPDIRLFLAWFRMAQWAYNHWGVIGRLVYTPYTLISTTFLGIELPVSCTIGPRLRMYHKVSIVIHHECTIGSDCQIRHGVTLASKFDRVRKTIVFPTIGDHVDIGACSAVIGDIHVGDHAEIGTHAVVTKSVPPWAIVVGNPGRVIRIGDPECNTLEVWSKTFETGSSAGEPPAAAGGRVPAQQPAGRTERSGT